MSDAIESSGAVTSESAPVAPQTTDAAQENSGAAAEAPVATSTPANEPIYEIVSDGVTLRMTLDEMKKHAQMGTSAAKRFQEAAQTKKQAEQILAKLKQNPIEAAREAGVSPAAFREMVEKYLYDQIKYDEMTPEQREYEELKKFKTQAEKEKEDRDTKERQEKQDQEVIHYQNQYIAAYDKAFSSSGVPKSEGAVQRVSQILLEALESSWDMPVEMAVEQYKKEQSNNLQSYLSGLNPDQLEQILGKDKLKELRKKDLAGLKNPAGSSSTKSASTPPAKKEKTTASKFFETIGK